MKTKITKYEVGVPTLDGTRIAERVTVEIPLEWDEEIQEWLLTAEAHRIIDETKVRLMGLVRPEQMKELRQRLGYTQRQMGELFQVGEKSWTRWESGKHRPSRSISLLIKALYDKEVRLDYLLEQASASKCWESHPELTVGKWNSVLAELKPVESLRRANSPKQESENGFSNLAASPAQNVVVANFKASGGTTKKELNEVIASAA